MTERERLIDLLLEWGNKENDGVRAESIADYLLANGVIVPPCKVGDTVYYIAFGKIYKGKCHAITQHINSLQIHLYDYDGDNASIASDKVFLTKEEAEKVLHKINHAEKGR